MDLCTCVHECTYGWGDVEAAQVGCWPVVDLTLSVESAISVVSAIAPDTAPVGQAVQVCPVPTPLWVSKDIKCSDRYGYITMPGVELHKLWPTAKRDHTVTWAQ